MATGSTLHELLLNLDGRCYPEAYVRRAHDRFAFLVAQVDGDGLSERPPRHQLRVMWDLVFRQARIRYHKTTFGNDFSLARTLIDKFGACLGITALYLCFSDALGLRFSAILYDGHIAPCLLCDNEQVWHLDPITMQHKCDGWLASVYQGPPIGGDEYKPLSVQEFLGVYVCNLAVFARSRFARLADTLKELEFASTLFPGYPTPWMNRAQILRQMGFNDQAREAAQRAITLGAGPLGRQWLESEGLVPIANPGGHEGR